jgi:hypothetical protein
MLRAYDECRIVDHVSYPVQAISFRYSLTMLGPGGEVVVDYALRAKQEYSDHNLIVAGYCNDVMAYIPSLRVLREGGYEGGDAMIFFGLPTPFAETVEEDVFRAIGEVMQQTLVSHITTRENIPGKATS